VWTVTHSRNLSHRALTHLPHNGAPAVILFRVSGNLAVSTITQLLLVYGVARHKFSTGHKAAIFVAVTDFDGWLALSRWAEQSGARSTAKPTILAGATHGDVWMYTHNTARTTGPTVLKVRGADTHVSIDGVDLCGTEGIIRLLPDALGRLSSAARLAAVAVNCHTQPGQLVWDMSPSAWSTGKMVTHTHTNTHKHAHTHTHTRTYTLTHTLGVCRRTYHRAGLQVRGCVPHQGLQEHDAGGG
jgi:hypothetical protein